jgi:hypothetical protein
MYLDGVGSARGYSGMMELLRSELAALGVDKTHVMATSSGGFVGLFAAHDLRATSFLGMSIRTDLSMKTALNNFELHNVGTSQDRSLFINLRDKIERDPWPKRVFLVTGDLNPIDRAHAENLDGLANVKIHYLRNYRAHDVLPGLLAAGQFDDVLNEFLADA